MRMANEDVIFILSFIRGVVDRKVLRRVIGPDLRSWFIPNLQNIAYCKMGHED